jgi:hypothetical protein
MPTLGGATLGDGVGTEVAVIVLDRFNSSTGAGDRFVATLDLRAIGTGGSGGGSAGCLTDGVVHRWRADGGPADAVGDADGNWVGDSAYTAGVTGQAFQFDGTGHVEVADSELDGLPSAGFSVGAWFNAVPTGDYQVIAEKFTPNFAPTGDDSVSDSWFLALTPGGTAYFATEIGTSAGRADLQWAGGPSLFGGAWHQMTTTYDGSMLRMYVDGSPVASVAAVGVLLDSPGVPVEIGSATNGGPRFWALHGAVDELTTWARALSAEEVAALAAGSDGDCTPQDVTAPTITFTGNAGTYSASAQVDITCQVVDTESGIASSNCPEVHGPAYEHLGVTTLTATATDVAGNASLGSTTFTVTLATGDVVSIVDQFVPERGRALALKALVRVVALLPDGRAHDAALRALDRQLGLWVGGTLTQAEANVILDLASQL